MEQRIWDSGRIRTTDLLPKHDLFFGSPYTDPMAGIPMGDGDTGSLFWISEDSLHISINHTDLWQQTTRDSEVYCSGEDENLTCMRHGGELTLSFPCPCLDMLYQKNYEQRLSLASATASLEAETPFSRLRARLFCSGEEKVSVLECTFAAEDQPGMSLRLSRWGSRNLWRWYAQGRNLPETGLDGTESSVKGNRFYLRQHLNATDFCIAAHIDLGTGEGKASVPNRHSAVMTVSPAETHHLTVYYCIRTGSDPFDAQKQCDIALDRVISSGTQDLYQRHCREWETFWNRSFISIENDYLENLYYLDLYYANCQLRGNHPPHFTSGLWGFQHDFLPWTCYFAYNMQHMYAPLDASGHGELGRGYYRMRREQLPVAEKAAEAVWGAKGAFYHDVTDFSGRCAEYDSSNATPGPQIAMMMWKHYRFCGDETFLKDIALPVMVKTADFYLSLLKKEEDGRYHLYQTSAYEGNPCFKDTVTDMVMIRALFGALLTLPGLEKEDQYREVLSHLPDWIRMPLDEGDLRNGLFGWGIGKGRKPQGDGMVLGSGIKEDGKPVRRTHGDPALEEYGFPEVELSLIYPAGIAGLKDKGSPLFDDLTNGILLHRTEPCMHWCMMAIYLARMGMAKELREFIPECINKWILYPNGMNAEYPPEEALDLSRYHTPREWSSKRKFRMRAYPFRHFDMEMLPILASAANEMLLQSYDGVIRICPAVLPDEAASFRLYAEGGFMVCASVNGTDCHVEITSYRGEDFRLELPERFSPDSIRISSDGTDFGSEWEQGILRISGLEKGKRLTLTTGKERTVPEPSPKNSGVKVCGRSSLGTDTLWW